MHHTGPHRTSLHYKLVSKSELTMCFRHFSNKLLQKLSKTFLKFFKKSSKILKNFLKMSKALSLQKKIGNDRTDRQTDRQTHIFRTKFSKRRASRQILRTLGQLEITHPKPSLKDKIATISKFLNENLPQAKLDNSLGL